MDYKVLLDTLKKHLDQTKAAYRKGTPGVEYEDMAAAARNLLTMRASYERATGRPVKSDPASKKQVAALLR